MKYSSKTTQTTSKINFIVYDDSVLFKPVAKYLTDELTITVKVMSTPKEKRMGMKPIRFVPTKLYEVVRQGGEQVVITYPGFLAKLLTACAIMDVDYDLDDRRTTRQSAGFPAPRLDLMYGFRFSQEDLLTSALAKDTSGLIGAPTRYSFLSTIAA